MKRDQRIAIVNGTGLFGKPKEYGYLAETWKDMLDLERNHRGELVAETHIFDATEQALAYLGKTGTLVYLAIAMLEEAEKVAREFPDIEVILFTGGDLPKGRLTIIKKDWVPGKNVISVLTY